MKKILQIALLLIVIAGITFPILKKGKSDTVTDEPLPAMESADLIPEQAAIAQPSVVVTYFTTDVRCKSCRAIESQTREVIEKQFADALANGSLVFQTKNIDREPNKHYVDEYQLAFKTVVISTMEHGKEVQFHKMDKVWELLNTPDAFADYMIKGIETSFLQSS